MALRLFSLLAAAILFIPQTVFAVDYCSAKGSSSKRGWIERVSIGALDSQSAASTYTNYSDRILRLPAGSSTPFTLKPGYLSGTNYSERWAVYIDLNQNGSFADAGELVASATGAGPRSGQLTVPTTALQGRTTLRVVMRYDGAPAACGTFSYGEVEDYTVVVTPKLPPNSTACAAGADLASAPPAFDHNGGKAVFADLAQVNTTLVYDFASKTVLGQAVVTFATGATGFPIIDLAPTPLSVLLDGQPISPERYTRIPSPDAAAQLRVLNVEVRPELCHSLIVTYTLPQRPAGASDNLDRFGYWTASSVNMFFDMVDAQTDNQPDAQYWENYGPTNLEFDRYQQNLTIRLQAASGAALEPHTVLSNGTLTTVSASEWRIAFPAWYTTSSFFVHLTKAADVQKLDRAHAGVPITLYAIDSVSPVNLEETYAFVTAAFDRFEEQYGPYPHPRFTAYVIPYPTSFSAEGMEFAGAAVSGLNALEHELLHSWFGRGVLPSDGDSGWIDEAVANWMDAGYANLSLLYQGNSLALLNHSAYSRGALPDASFLGPYSLATLQDMLERSGAESLRSLLGKFYRENVFGTINTAAFRTFLERKTGLHLGYYFARYVGGTVHRVPFQNPTQRLDVNGDRMISSADAMNVINYLNNVGSIFICTAPPTAFDGYNDVNGDCYVSAADALEVINYLNSQP